MTVIGEELPGTRRSDAALDDKTLPNERMLALRSWQ
jgi:hypothetical protein